MAARWLPFFYLCIGATADESGDPPLQQRSPLIPLSFSQLMVIARPLRVG